MPAASNIVLADALGTPVNHTFVPLGKDANNVYWFEDQSRPSAIGYWKLSVDVKRPLPGAPGNASSADRVARVKLAMHQPQLETLGTNDAGLTPPSTIAYISRSSVEFILPERGSLQDRKDLRKMTGLLVNDTQITGIVENLIPFTS